MRTHFPEFYPRTETELSSIWSGGLVVVDANVLLNLYHYPDTAFEEFLTVLGNLKDRLWLPYQVGLEYQRNRARALPQPRQSIERVLKGLSDAKSKTDAIGLPEFHPSLDLVETERLRDAVAAAIERAEEFVRAAIPPSPESEVPSQVPDRIRDRLDELFASRIGDPPKREALTAMCREADARFSKLIPPGFKDADKASDAKYGDFLIWKAMLAELSTRKDVTGLIFVTNDRKEDWWVRHEEQLGGPRPELVRECLDETERLLLLYTPSDFLRDSKARLKSVVSDETFAVVERVSRLSPVVATLRALRMSLLDVKTRVELLRHIYTRIESGNVRIAADIGPAIDSFGEQASNNYVSNPLFYALISDTYGPLSLSGDGQRLRDRIVSLKDADGGGGKFVQSAHVAWLAQAFFRLRRFSYSKVELADAFFGEGAGEEAIQLVELAEQAMQADALVRGH